MTIYFVYHVKFTTILLEVELVSTIQKSDKIKEYGYLTYDRYFYPKTNIYRRLVRNADQLICFDVIGRLVLK